MDPVLSNVSRKGNHAGAIHEASRTLMGEAFLVFIYLRSDRRNYLAFSMFFFVQDTYIREKKETGN